MSPQILERAFSRSDFDRDLVFRFFVIFSMFEYALKEAGFRHIDPRNDEIQPDWVAFARAIDGQFNRQADPELSVAVDYFLNHPTKKQVFRNNQIAFAQTQRPPNTSDTEWLSVLVRRVRNNLFHGGKVNYDRHRDTLLIQFSIVILESWAVLDQNVEMALHHIH